MLDALRPHRHVGQIRQKGFMVGIELVADKATRKPFDPRRREGAALCTRARRHGVILRPLADVIVINPPLAMETTDLQQIVAAVTAEIQQIVA
jgi:adenosylmethionine-8-amino-7-oxononanoate aminotransferase